MCKMFDFPHQPVLLQPLLDLLANYSIPRVWDGTLGAGGHAHALFSTHPEIISYIGVDRDCNALKISELKLAPWKKKLEQIYGNFADILPQLAREKSGMQEGAGGHLLVLIDLGVSSMQLDTPERGFSFMRDGPLDMRMDPSQRLKAEEIVNSWDEMALGKIFREFGEEQHWRLAARKIVQAREKSHIATTEELIAILEPSLRFFYKKQKKHPLTKIFQALRIAVNGELDALEKVLNELLAELPSGAILAIITFHSLEDRMVKQAFGYAASDKYATSGIGPGLFLNKEPTVRQLTRKAIVPSEEEIAMNPRSRSAKLRIVEKI
jgi:16S rRNA (cytosine1402-N4)-methyltransferase